MGKIKGIIFDMDNTLLHSSIDFAAMKHELRYFLISENVLSEEMAEISYTSSMLIDTAIKTGRMSIDKIKEMWEIPKKHEVAGMQDAGLEPGVIDLLSILHGNFLLAIVTNNSVEAAKTALKHNDISELFDLVVGREMVNALKPSPDGYLYVLDAFPGTNAEEWLSVGDSWIDGAASFKAGIRFIAYNSDHDKLKNNNVEAYAIIKDIGEVVKYLDS